MIALLRSELLCNIVGSQHSRSYFRLAFFAVTAPRFFWPANGPLVEREVFPSWRNNVADRLDTEVCNKIDDKRRKANSVTSFSENDRLPLV